MNVPYKITTNDKLVIVDIDQGLCDYLQQTKSSFIKKDFDRFVSPQCLPSFLTTTLKSMHGKPTDVQMMAFHIDSTEYSFEYRITPSIDNKFISSVTIELTPLKHRVICSSGNE